MRTLRAVGNTFIVVGLTLLLFAAYELVGTSIVTNRHQSALAEEFDDSIVRGARPDTPAVGERPRPARYTGPPPIARIRIPRIGVNDIVVEGTTLQRLAWGPGRYTSTATIGARGTTGIAGHRTGWGSPFIDVDRLDRGDEIVLETKDRIHTYRVTGARVVNPSDVWVLAGDPSSRAVRKLTLTTCTPKYTSRDRLIVWADHVSAVRRT